MNRKVVVLNDCTSWPSDLGLSSILGPSIFDIGAKKSLDLGMTEAGM
jgi:hypothetical protein